MKRKLYFYTVIAFGLVFAFHVIYFVWRTGAISSQWAQIEENAGRLALYLRNRDYFTGLSYALAGAFTVYAFLKFIEHRRGGLGIISGAAITGIIYFAGCWLLGCCGSPLLPVYLSLFGSSFLGFTKPLIFILTVISIVIGYLLLRRKAETAKGCCLEDEKGNCGGRKTGIVPDVNPVNQITSELNKGMVLTKCRKCGCMKDVLENISSASAALQPEVSAGLLKEIRPWLACLEPVEYSCLGCKYCFSAEAMNAFQHSFQETASSSASSCSIAGQTRAESGKPENAVEERCHSWPVSAGEYFASCTGSDCPVAVSTLASPELAERLNRDRPKELCITGKTETENIGIDKIIQNTIANPTIRFLIVAGRESEGHRSGQTLIKLWENGVDEGMRVIGSPGRRPFLSNVAHYEVEAFRKQVHVIDMINCEDETRIIEMIEKLTGHISPASSREGMQKGNTPIHISMPAVIQAKELSRIKLDKAGYFVIIPRPDRKVIVVEHYANDNKLLRVIEGKDARTIYGAIVENGWVTELSHAAYLGKELSRAELSFECNFKYLQDKAYVVLILHCLRIPRCFQSSSSVAFG